MSLRVSRQGHDGLHIVAAPPGEGGPVREGHELGRLFGGDGSVERAVDPAIEDEGRDQRCDEGRREGGTGESSRRQGGPPERGTWGRKGSTVEAARERESV
jgi:hypothetical protein